MTRYPFRQDFFVGESAPDALPAAAPRPAWWRWAVWAISSQFGLALTVCLGLLWHAGRLAWWEAGGLWLFAFGGAAAFALDDRLLPPGRNAPRDSD